MAKPLTLKIMMLGGRRAGKTSTLAAMHSCFGRIFQGTDLSLIASGQSMDVLANKRKEIEEYVNKASRNINFVPDGTPTPGDETYRFQLKLKDKPDVINLDFYDFNGEWLVGDASNNHQEDIRQSIHESDVLMIIIDTPYLMEEDGTYNDVRNRYFKITELIRENLDLNRSVPKMILFVPIKCEKYYDENRMDEVYQKVLGQRCYAELIDYCRSQCEIAVTPILTMGTASFCGFDFDETGETCMAKEKDGWEFPSKPLYGFTDKAKEAARCQGLERKYAVDPKFCEQPAVYTIAYALTYAGMVAKVKEARNKKGFLGKLLGKSLITFLRSVAPAPIWDILPDDLLTNLIDKLCDRYDFTSSEAFYAQRKIVYDKLKKSGDGYDILAPDVLDFKGVK